MALYHLSRVVSRFGRRVDAHGQGTASNWQHSVEHRTIVVNQTVLTDFSSSVYGVGEAEGRRLGSSRLGLESVDRLLTTAIGCLCG